MPTIEQHWKELRAMGCIVTGRPNPTIHHCHGGSMRELGHLRGMKQKVSDWLVIPLDAELHTGRIGIDAGIGVQTWEKRFGRQLDFLREVAERTGRDVFALAGISE